MGPTLLNGTHTTTPGGPRSRLLRFEPWLVPLILSLLFIFVSGEVALGRFWAEEGREFLKAVFDRGPLGEVFYLFHGQLQLWTNVTVAVASLAGIRTAPIITTYAAGAVIIAISAGVWRYRRRLGLTRATAGILIGFYWFTPQAAELWATSTNLQWHLGLLAALLLASPADGRRRWLIRGLLVACGLSGIPACVLAPAFIFAAAMQRSRERLIQGGILLALLVMQASLVRVLGDLNGRQMAFDAFAFIKAFIAQTIYSPFFGDNLLNTVLPDLRNNAMVWGLTYVGIVLFVTPLFIARKRTRVAILLFASISVAAAGYFGMKGDEPGLTFSGSMGGRYFFAPALLSILAWLTAIESRLPVIWPEGLFSRLILVGALLPLFWLNATNSPWRKVFFHGPLWAVEIRDMQLKDDRTLQLWPDTPEWVAIYPADRR